MPHGRELRIRAFGPADLDALMVLFGQAVRALGGDLYSVAEVEAWAGARADAGEWLVRRLAKPTWVAEIDGRIVGFTDLEPSGHIDMLFVDPSVQRSGVASALLNHVEHEARRRGLAQLDTDASLAARAVFGRRGYSVEAPQEVRIGCEVLRNFRMVKRLVER